MSADLEHIITHGNRFRDDRPGRFDNWIECADGTRLSVIAGWGAYCERSKAGPFTHVEVMTGPTPGSWHRYSDGLEDTCPTVRGGEECTCGGVYARVPVDLVREFIVDHGGTKAVI